MLKSSGSCLYIDWLDIDPYRSVSSQKSAEHNCASFLPQMPLSHCFYTSSELAAQQLQGSVGFWLLGFTKIVQMQRRNLLCNHIIKIQKSGFPSSHVLKAQRENKVSWKRMKQMN